MYFDAHFIFNTFRSRGVFMFVLCLMILCSVRPSFAAEAEAIAAGGNYRRFCY